MTYRPQRNRRISAIGAGAVVLFALSGCISEAERESLDQALDAAAARIHAKMGTLVKYDHFGGAADGPRSLIVITLRDGSAEDVAKAQINDAEAAGYKSLFGPPCGGPTGGCGFDGPASAPSLSLETRAENATSSTGQPVPAGKTEVIISLWAHATTT